MPKDLSDRTAEPNHTVMVEVRRSELTQAGRGLANTLWGIERYGVAEHHSPPPLHTDMAWQLQTDKSLRDALRAALDAVDAEIN